MSHFNLANAAPILVPFHCDFCWASFFFFLLSLSCAVSGRVGIWLVKPFGRKPTCLLWRLLPACVRVYWLSCVVDLLLLCVCACAHACVEWVKQARTIIPVWLGVLPSPRVLFFFFFVKGFRCSELLTKLSSCGHYSPICCLFRKTGEFNFLYHFFYKSLILKLSCEVQQQY